MLSSRKSRAEPPRPAAEVARKIGLISDTHGLLRPEALQALRGSDLIVHAGDVGDPTILEALAKIASVIAVRGNVDTADWAKSLPETAVAEADGVNIYVLHDSKTLDLDPKASQFHIVISGHSHKPSRSEKNGVLYINPGSAGPRRFKLPVAIAYLRIVSGSATAEIHHIL